METKTAIETRRSIRRFTNKPIEREMIEELLELTIQSPSAKNDQPWRFVVLREQSKTDLLERLEEKAQALIENNIPTGSLRGSIRAMQEAPVLILIYNGISREGLGEREEYAKFLVDTQSLGSAIQTMLLGAQSMGIGSLWICDVLYASEEIGAFVGKKEELVAAVALGYAEAWPNARPRRDWSEITKFID